MKRKQILWVLMVFLTISTLAGNCYAQGEAALGFDSFKQSTYPFDATVSYQVSLSERYMELYQTSSQEGFQMSDHQSEYWDYVQGSRIYSQYQHQGKTYSGSADLLLATTPENRGKLRIIFGDLKSGNDLGFLGSQAVHFKLINGKMEMILEPYSSGNENVLDEAKGEMRLDEDDHLVIELELTHDLYDDDGDVQGTVLSKVNMKSQTPVELNQPQVDEGFLKGKLFISAGDTNQVSPHQVIIAGVLDDKNKLIATLDTFTDEEGRFEFKDQQIPVGKGYTVNITAPLSFVQPSDKKVLFQVTDKRWDESKAVLIDCGNFGIDKPEDLEMNVSLYGGKILDQDVEEEIVHQYIDYYDLMQLGMRYYLDKDTVNHSFTLLPMNLVLNDDAATDYTLAYYFRPKNNVYIPSNRMDLFESHQPYTLYHELAHYVMHDIYGGDYPYIGDGNMNHGGYANSTTADSFSEGFAHFMGYVVARQTFDIPYPPEGSMEINHAAWAYNGKAEEMAVAGILYDLIDGGDHDDDEIQLPSIDVWKILTDEPLPHFGAVYDKLKEKYNTDNEKMSAIGQVFLDHGFFVVSSEPVSGKDTYDYGEAFLDKNANGRYDAGESHVDYSYTASLETGYLGPAHQDYSPDYTVGYAGYFSNQTRKSQLVLPGHFVHTNGNPINVSVTFEDHPELNYDYTPTIFGEMAYVPFPPSSYKAQINITGDATSTIDSETFYENQEELLAEGYYLKLDLPKAAISKTSQGFTSPLTIGLLGAGFLILLIALVVKRLFRRPV